MKNWRILIFSIMITANAAFAVPHVIDKIVAVVNNEVLLKSEVDSIFNNMVSKANDIGYKLPNDKILRHQILEHQIMDNIILQLGKTIGIQVNDKQLEQVIALQNHITHNQLRKLLASEGISYTTYRKQLRKEILITAIRNNEVRRHIVILPEEVDTISKQISLQNIQHLQINISQILLPLPENAIAKQVNDQEKLAKELIKKIKKGIDFNTLAISYSIAPEALQDGSMGWNTIEELPTIFEQALRTAKKGDIIGPIHSGVGFHILKVNGLRDETKSISATQVHLRHIFLKPSPFLSEDQAVAKLNQIFDRIKNGKTTFIMAANQFSNDSNSAKKGGDLGWSTLEIYDPIFSNAILQLNKGQISKPLHSSFGYHLIQLIDIRKVDKTHETQKERAYRLLFNRKFLEQEQVWMQKQRGMAYVKIMDTYDY